MPGKIHLQVLSPEKTLFEGEVSRVTLPGKVGSFTVLPMHAPIISSLVGGVIAFAEYRPENPRQGVEHIISISGGFVEVKSDNVTICVEKAE